VIDNCKDFLLICSENSLDRCNNDGDWVRLEIAHALEKGKNIIPVMLRGFAFPETLPADIEPIRMQNGVNANSHEYFDAAIDRLAEKFLISKPKIPVLSSTTVQAPSNSHSGAAPVLQASPNTPSVSAPQTKKCQGCGFELPVNMNFCGQCGFTFGTPTQPAYQQIQPQQYVQPQQAMASYSNNMNNIVVNVSNNNTDDGKSSKSTAAAFWLCFFLGNLGIHRFYVGKAGTGILWFLTSGLLGLGSFIDIFRIAYGSFSDFSGKKLAKSTGLKILVWFGILFQIAMLVGAVMLFMMVTGIELF
jgi:TM2 domain-containing membrane protein YozV